MELRTLRGLVAFVAVCGAALLPSCSEASVTAEPGPRAVAQPQAVPAEEPTAPITAAHQENAPSVAAAEPEPAPPEPVFAGNVTVTVTELIEALEQVAVAMEASPVVLADYQAFILEQGVEDTPTLFRDYVRVKLAFEATRDGGLWGLRWTITNRKPNSEAIWAQWKALPLGEQTALADVTADAECDELSALFAFFVRRLGVDHVGLFWPEWNHVVAVWTIPQSTEAVRVVVPTSQIFLDTDASLGTHGFNPRKQKTIYTYKRKDVRLSHQIPAELAEFFVAQARRYGSLSQAELQERRNARAGRLGGS